MQRTYKGRDLLHNVAHTFHFRLSALSVGITDNFVIVSLHFELSSPPFKSLHSSDPEVIKLFFMLNSTEYDIFHANKSQITNNAKLFLAKHS